MLACFLLLFLDPPPTSLAQRVEVIWVSYAFLFLLENVTPLFAHKNGKRQVFGCVESVR
jgi:hypothetical protein